MSGSSSLAPIVPGDRRLNRNGGGRSAHHLVTDRWTCRRYCSRLGTGASPAAERKGAKPTARFRLPVRCRPKKRMYGGQGKAVGCVPPTALLFVPRPAYMRHPHMGSTQSFFSTPRSSSSSIIVDSVRCSSAALIRRSFAQHATAMFFAHFVGDAGSREPVNAGRSCRAARISTRFRLPAGS